MFSEVLKRVAAQLSNELPFVIYRKPNASTVTAMLQNNSELHTTKDFTEKGFVFAPFDRDAPMVLLHSDEHLKAEYEATTKPETEMAPSFQEGSPDREFHLKLVKKGIAAIANGTFDKVVLSRRISVDCSERPIPLFQKLVATYESAFCYLWYHPKVGLWLGATPEILLRAANKRLTTMSLAGTQAFKASVGPSWGKKEYREQEMVTNYIVQALKDDVSQLKLSEVESVRAGQLWHLRTKLTATIDANLTPIVSALHPTPAVCGLPMQEARAFIRQHENYERKYYTGFLGELNMKQEKFRSNNPRNRENRAYRTFTETTELFVNLRCMQLKQNKALVYVGGGITEDSNPEKEWEETVAKGKTMLRILANS